MRLLIHLSISILPPISLSPIIFVSINLEKLALLESLRSNRINDCVNLISKNVRRYLQVKHYQNKRKAALLIQRYIRGTLARIAVTKIRQETSVRLLQRVVRGWLVRRKYQKTRTAVLTIQTGTLSFSLILISFLIPPPQLDAAERDYEALRLTYDCSPHPFFVN